jgi:hypothetical protein
MALCKKCNKKLKFLDIGAGGICLSCYGIEQESLKRDEDIELHQQMAEQDAKIDAIMLTTETAPNLNMTKRIEIVTAACGTMSCLWVRSLRCPIQTLICTLSFHHKVVGGL